MAQNCRINYIPDLVNDHRWKGVFPPFGDRRLCHEKDSLNLRIYETQVWHWTFRSYGFIKRTGFKLDSYCIRASSSQCRLTAPCSHDDQSFRRTFHLLRSNAVFILTPSHSIPIHSHRVFIGTEMESQWTLIRFGQSGWEWTDLGPSWTPNCLAMQITVCPLSIRCDLRCRRRERMLLAPRCKERERDHARGR